MQGRKLTLRVVANTIIKLFKDHFTDARFTRRTAGTKQQKSSAKRCGAYAGRSQGVDAHRTRTS